MKYRILSDDEFKKNGFDPKWFPYVDNDELPPQGPYVATPIIGMCPCCGAEQTGWTVVDLSTATAASTTHYSDNGQCDAEEDAGLLNGAWLAGWATLDAQYRAGAVARKNRGGDGTDGT